MRIGIDGIPLATLKTGIGHYTLEIARGVAQLAPENDFQLVAPVPLELETHADGDLPRNLRSVHAPMNVLRRRWWTIGLPLYVRQNRLDLFHQAALPDHRRSPHFARTRPYCTGPTPACPSRLHPRSFQTF